MAHIDDPETQRANLNFIKASMREPLLSRDHEFELAIQWREAGNEEALHELVRAYTRLVIATASKFRNYGLPMGDLVQEGNVGLMQAAARFEPGREVRFSTYAAWWIRSAIDSGRNGSNSASARPTTSGRLVQSLAITGAPHAIASAAGRPKPSCNEGNTNRVQTL